MKRTPFDRRLIMTRAARGLAEAVPAIAGRTQEKVAVGEGPGGKVAGTRREGRRGVLATSWCGTMTGRQVGNVEQRPCYGIALAVS